MESWVSENECEISRAAEIFVFDLFCWWQTSHPSASVSELADWWAQNRGTRTNEEFSRLLKQVLTLSILHESSLARICNLLASPILQQRIERMMFHQVGMVSPYCAEERALYV